MDTRPLSKSTYCFDALMKDRFMDKIKLAKFPNEFDVAQHFDLGNGTLLLLLRGKRVVMFVIDCGETSKSRLREEKVFKKLFSKLQ